MTISQARIRFSREVDKIGGIEAAGHLLGVDGSYISLIRNGKRTPGLQLAIRIEKKWRIPASSWKQPS